jgi:ADP-ribose pyrophosphatase YjhB (NUDIX family)
MSEPGSTPAAPRVGVYALIGRDERLLLIKHPEHDALPGGPVHAGEPIEKALGRTLRDQLGATIATFEFCTVVEHGATKPGQPTVWSSFGDPI